MDKEQAPRIVSVDRFDDFIIVGFSNGKGGRYPAALLYSVLQQDEELDEPSSASDFEAPDGCTTQGF